MMYTSKPWIWENSSTLPIIISQENSNYIITDTWEVVVEPGVWKVRPWIFISTWQSKLQHMQYNLGILTSWSRSKPSSITTFLIMKASMLGVWCPWISWSLQINCCNRNCKDLGRKHLAISTLTFAISMPLHTVTLNLFYISVFPL